MTRKYYNENSYNADYIANNNEDVSVGLHESGLSIIVSLQRNCQISALIFLETCQNLTWQYVPST